MARSRSRIPAADRRAVDPGSLRLRLRDVHGHRPPGRLVRKGDSPLLIFPFATAAGGIAQGAAALWAYKARDGLATAIHGIWAAFWLGYGFLNFMIALKLIPAPAPHAAVPELGYWFFVLAAVTLVGMIASLGESLALTAVLAPLWVGAALLGVFYPSAAAAGRRSAAT